jgi:hypothetical protein
MGPSSCCQEGGSSLPRRIPKELRVSLLTVFGVLSTIGIGLVLRHIPALSRLVLAGEDAFVTFNIYGLAFSLIASASIVMRRRDTTILILAATILWGIFMAKGLASEMIRFVIFAALITIGVRVGRAAMVDGARAARIGLSTFVAGVLCALGGLVYYWAGRLVAAPESAVAGGIAVGLLWGLSLGAAVAVGVTLGNEVLDWMASKPR